MNGSNDHEGRAEILHNNIWGTFCDNGWAVAEAKVICRSLGLPYENAIAKTNAYFGQGTGPIWLKDLGCGGKEERILDCPHSGWENTNCKHPEDAGVVCQ